MYILLSYTYFVLFLPNCYIQLMPIAMTVGIIWRIQYTCILGFYPGNSSFFSLYCAYITLIPMFPTIKTLIYFFTIAVLPVFLGMMLKMLVGWTRNKYVDAFFQITPSLFQSRCNGSKCSGDYSCFSYLGELERFIFLSFVLYPEASWSCARAFHCVSHSDWLCFRLMKLRGSLASQENR